MPPAMAHRLIDVRSSALRVCNTDSWPSTADSSVRNSWSFARMRALGSSGSEDFVDELGDSTAGLVPEEPLGVGDGGCPAGTELSVSAAEERSRASFSARANAWRCSASKMSAVSSARIASAHVISTLPLTSDGTSQSDDLTTLPLGSVNISCRRPFSSASENFVSRRI
jgi:hypothetical protein